MSLAVVAFTAAAVSISSKLSSAELALLSRVGGPRSATYGELTAIGMYQVFGGDFVLTKEDVFVDLGSGAGKLVLQAAEDYKVAKAIGIELSRTRHEEALTLLEEAVADVQERVSFLCCDAAGDEAAMVLAGATSAWVANLCFDDSLQRRLAARLEESPSVVRVAALMPFPDGLKGFEICGASILAETSWTRDVPSDLIASGAMTGHPCTRYRRITSGGGEPEAEYTRTTGFALPPAE